MKYHSRKTEVDGITFDSKAESRRYMVLKLMEDQGTIKDLELQPRFLLQAAYTSGSGKKIRKLEYVADFLYKTETGKVVVEDVKGMKTKEYRIKKKIFEKIYYPLTVTEVS